MPLIDDEKLLSTMDFVRERKKESIITREREKQKKIVNSFQQELDQINCSYFVLT